MSESKVRSAEEIAKEIIDSTGCGYDYAGRIEKKIAEAILAERTRLEEVEASETELCKKLEKQQKEYAEQFQRMETQLAERDREIIKLKTLRNCAKEELAQKDKEIARLKGLSERIGSGWALIKAEEMEDKIREQTAEIERLKSTAWYHMAKGEINRLHEAYQLIQKKCGEQEATIGGLRNLVKQLLDCGHELADGLQRHEDSEDVLDWLSWENVAKKALNSPSSKATEKCGHDKGDIWQKDLGFDMTTFNTKRNYPTCPFCPSQAPAENKLSDPCPYCKSRTCCRVLWPDAPAGGEYVKALEGVALAAKIVKQTGCTSAIDGELTDALQILDQLKGGV